MHLLLEGGVDHALIDCGELREVYRLGATISHSGEVAIELIGKEWRNRRNEESYGFKASVECLICRQFVGSHFSCPEALAVESHIPVAEIVADEVGDCAGSLCRLIVFKLAIDFSDERIEQRDNPAVDFWALAHWHLRQGVVEAVNVGIESEE